MADCGSWVNLSIPLGPVPALAFGSEGRYGRPGGTERRNGTQRDRN